MVGVVGVVGSAPRPRPRTGGRSYPERAGQAQAQAQAQAQRGRAGLFRFRLGWDLPLVAVNERSVELADDAPRVPLLEGAVARDVCLEGAARAVLVHEQQRLRDSRERRAYVVSVGVAHHMHQPRDVLVPPVQGKAQTCE